MRTPPPDVFGVRSDGAAGASSASDLLVTVFGELMRPGGGTAWTQTFVAALGLVGVEEKATRQAISRLADKSWVTSERVGRRTLWALTPWATDILERGAERIYGLGRRDRDDPARDTNDDTVQDTGDDWNGTWLVLLASVPEAQRSIRGPLGVRLGWAGFGSLGQGVWVCPEVEREAEASAVLDQFGADATMFRSKMTSTGDPAALARRAWRLDELAARYELFLTSTGLDPTVLATDEASDPALATAALIRLVDAWRTFPLIDPDLPASLLPDDWPGHAAAALFARRRAALVPVAAGWWSDTDAGFD